MRVWDRYGVEFFLEKLSNCSLWDAYKILNCQKKVLSDNETAFLVPKDELSIWGKSDFYIQKVSLPPNLKTSEEGEIFLMENIVAERCDGVDKLDERTWWLYAARHNSGLRIIAGIGKGIMLSRFLPLDADPSDEISKTVLYLQRFGIGKNIKIFSPLHEIRLQKISPEIVCERFYVKKCDDSQRNRADLDAVRPVISNGNCFGKFLNDKILYAILAAVVLTLCGVDSAVRRNEKIILSLKKSVRAATPDMELEINDENLHIAQKFVDALRNSPNPLELLRKALRICRMYNISVEQLLIENGLKIKTSLNKAIFDKIKSVVGVDVEKISGDEYEELGSNKKFGAVICIK
ncbi:MAG: hypothetical protein LBO02_01930 [Holosporaceae bacterium]|jgi:hypothetical protein|nr:hypothetical protein [Holosporaceae bacterium]